jgi:hypothetical protein
MTVPGEHWPLEHELMRQLNAARESGRRVPDFFIAGHAKCGTTALYEMLRGHPQIYMPELKETQFLAREPQDRPLASNTHPRTLEEYLALFAGAPAEQRAGEASASYLRSSVAARRIAALCPHARIIAIFREPASFLRSLHLQWFQFGVDTEADFATAIALEPERRRGNHLPRPPDSIWVRALFYSEHVRYVEQLRRYHECLGREQVLAQIYDDFRADNQRVVREVLRFLGVDDSLEIAPTEANPSVRLRSPRMHQLAHALSQGRGPASRALRTSVKAVTPRRARRRAMRAADRRVPDSGPRRVEEPIMAELRRRFKPEVVALSEYLQRDLVALWGYQDVP